MNDYNQIINDETILYTLFIDLLIMNALFIVRKTKGAEKRSKKIK